MDPRAVCELARDVGATRLRVREGASEVEVWLPDPVGPQPVDVESSGVELPSSLRPFVVRQVSGG